MLVMPGHGQTITLEGYLPQFDRFSRVPPEGGFSLFTEPTRTDGQIVCGVGLREIIEILSGVEQHLPVPADDPYSMMRMPLFQYGDERGFPVSDGERLRREATHADDRDKTALRVRDLRVKLSVCVKGKS